jgi:hypothetical protein
VSSQAGQVPLLYNNHDEANGLLLSCRSSHLLYGNSVGIIKAVQRLTSPDEKSHEITEVNSSIKNFCVFPPGSTILSRFLLVQNGGPGRK